MRPSVRERWEYKALEFLDFKLNVCTTKPCFVASDGGVELGQGLLKGVEAG